MNCSILYYVAWSPALQCLVCWWFFNMPGVIRCNSRTHGMPAVPCVFGELGVLIIQLMVFGVYRIQRPIEVLL